MGLQTFHFAAEDYLQIDLLLKKHKKKEKSQINKPTTSQMKKRTGCDNPNSLVHYIHYGCQIYSVLF